MALVLESILNAEPQRLACSSAPYVAADDGRSAGERSTLGRSVASATLRRKSTFGNRRSVTLRLAAHVEEPPCVRTFPRALRDQHQLLLALPTRQTTRGRHALLARSFATTLGMPDSEVCCSTRTVRRACHHPTFLEELAKWMQVLRKQVVSFAHLVAHVYEVFLGPGDVSAAANQGTSFVWVQYCVPVLRHCAALEADEFGGGGVGAVGDAEKIAMTGPRLARWLTGVISCWVRNATGLLRPEDAVSALEMLRLAVEQRIHGHAQVAAAPSGFGAAHSLRRRTSLFSTMRSATGSVSAGTARLAARLRAAAKQTQQRTFDDAAAVADAEWSPLFVEPELIENVSRYLASRKLAPAAVKAYPNVLQHMLDFTGILLSECGQQALRSRIDDRDSHLVPFLRVLDKATGDDYGRCSRVVDRLIAEHHRHSTTAFDAKAVAARCGYVLRPEHMQAAERNVVMLEELRSDTVMSAFEEAVKARIMPVTREESTEALRGELRASWIRSAKVQMQPNAPVYVRPFAAGRRPSSAPRTTVTTAQPTVDDAAKPAATPRVPKPPRIAKYAAAKEQQRHDKHTAATVEYVALSRLIRRAQHGAELAVAVPGVDVAARSHASVVARAAAGAAGMQRPAVDATTLHCGILHATKPTVEALGLRFSDVNVAPETVSDLTNVDPGHHSFLRDYSDGIARRSHRTKAKREMVARMTQELQEAGRGSHNVHLSVDIDGMVHDAYADLLASDSDASSDLEGAFDENEWEPVARHAELRPDPMDELTVPPQCHDQDAIARDVNNELPLPDGLVHVDALDVSGLVHRYVR